MRLFVIGNGFDINLGLNTSYKAFYHFLKSNYPMFLSSIGDVLWANNETAPLWSNFERELSAINFLPFSIEDYECDDDVSFDELYDMKINNIFEWKDLLDKYFKEWIASSYNITQEKSYHFSKNDYFINFNYTKSLEDCFLIDSNRILYIHGKFDNEERLIFGHGETHDLTKLYDDLNFTQDGFIECSASQLNDLIAIDTLIHELHKPVEKIKEKLERWLSSLPKITEIYVLGHSLGDVDLPYFEIIKKIAISNVKWKFSYYSDDDINKIMSKADKIKIKKYSIGTIDELLIQNAKQYDIV